MNREDFLEELQDVLQREHPLTSGMELKNLPEWDSLAMMATVAFFDQKFNQTLIFTDFETFFTVEDLMKKAGL